MVKFGQPEPRNKYKGTVEEVEYIDDMYNEGRQKVHLVIKPDFEVKGETGKMHEFIPISGTTSDEVVNEDSVLAKYITLIYAVEKDSERIEKWKDVFNFIKGKQYTFEKQRLGRAFGGKPAREAQRKKDYNEGYIKGHDEGYEEGQRNAKRDIQDKYKEDYNLGYNEGHKKGYNEGTRQGNDEGYKKGYLTAQEYYEENWISPGALADGYRPKIRRQMARTATRREK